MEYYEERYHKKYLGQMRRGWHLQVVKYDLLRDYRNTIPLEEQVIFYNITQEASNESTA